VRKKKKKSNLSPFFPLLFPFSFFVEDPSRALSLSLFLISLFFIEEGGEGRDGPAVAERWCFFFGTTPPPRLLTVILSPPPFFFFIKKKGGKARYRKSK
jgi:hypothetical protein